MCGYSGEEMPPIPPFGNDPNSIKGWLFDMARWERRRPANIRIRNKRLKWQQIHDYTAERHLNSQTVTMGRFWYCVMMRAKANQAKFNETTYWQRQSRATV